VVASKAVRQQLLVVGPTGCPGGLPVGEDRGETLGTLLNIACRFPILVQHSSRSTVIPQATLPVAVSTACVGPTGALLANLKTPLGRGAKAGTCSTCSYNRSLYSRMVARTFST
jgi:hypothetical protein